MKHKYLVTGGAGFIGSHIIEELLRRGETVRSVDNFLTGKRENIAPFMDKIDFIEGDIRDSETCRLVAEGMDVILHQAALPSVPRSIQDPLLTNDINIRGTLSLLIASSKAGVRKFVFASSSSVYGDDPYLPKKEGREGNPLSPYAASKRAGELYCQVFSRAFGLQTVCLRYFNIFGPRQDPTSQYAAVIPLFVTRMLRGEKPTVFGDGEQSRDFTYVANVVKANILAAETENVSGEVFNIGCGQRTTVNDLASKINDILGKDIRSSYAEQRPGDVKHSHADISKARKLLKYNPAVNFNEGLKRVVQYYQERK